MTGNDDARPSTRWGDRTQRRLDILDAARSCIEGDGYLSLNMRDLAADAGVSPATLYSYFHNKEELFATLYAEAIRAHTQRYQAVVDREPPLMDLLAQLLGLYIQLYESYGRHFTMWSAMRRDPDEESSPSKVSRDLVRELRAATIENNRLLISSIRAAAEREGRRMADDRLVPSLLWSYLTGIADHVTTERGSLDPFPAAELVAFAAERLVLTLTDPA